MPQDDAKSAEHQNLIMDFIREYIEEEGLPPSQREIADGCGLWRSSVKWQVDKLVAMGELVKKPNKARGLFPKSLEERK